MTLKQVEPVECNRMQLDTFTTRFGNTIVVIYGETGQMMLGEPEARALLEWLRKVCE